MCDWIHVCAMFAQQMYMTSIIFDHIFNFDIPQFDRNSTLNAIKEQLETINESLYKINESLEESKMG